MEQIPFQIEEWMIYGLFSWSGFLYGKWHIEETIDMWR